MLTIGCDASGRFHDSACPWISWACVTSDGRTLHGRIRQTNNTTLGELVALTQAATLIPDRGTILTDAYGLVLWLERLRARPNSALPVPDRYRWIPEEAAAAAHEQLLMRPEVVVEWRRRGSTKLMLRAHHLANDAHRQHLGDGQTSEGMAC